VTTFLVAADWHSVLVNAYSEPNVEELRDVSSDICWQGGFNRERCCRGDEKTTAECWDGMYSFGECCPNADCWEGEGFSYSMCCGAEHGPKGNPACWSGVFTYEHCCLADSTGQSWVDVMVEGVDTEQFYAIDDFYTDAQYGDDFGYYSTGNVLKSTATPTKAGLHEKEQFAHFTTYPMALSPHFARVFCRLLFVMWAELGERTPFRVVEMGAGSGQLAYDIQQCVRSNEIGLDPPTWRRWHAAVEYTIMERSPALAKRQRERGLRVVSGDAQTTSSCKPVLKALAESVACSGPAARRSPECTAKETGTEEAGASVVLSNELLDAFAPLKLRLSLYGKADITLCRSWQEVRLVHALPEKDLRELGETMGYSTSQLNTLIEDLRRYTEAVFCRMANTTVGQEARTKLPKGTSCLTLVLALGDIVNHLDLGVPAALHNMRLRLRKDAKVWMRLVEIAGQFDEEVPNAIVLPRDTYRSLRHQMRSSKELEAHFLTIMQTYQVPVPLTEERCQDLDWWFKAHESRVSRLANFYRGLGYPAVHLVVRPGERNFIELVDCLLGPSGGFKLSIDYGASFEALGHSLSIDPKNDGIFVPPIPHELMVGLPECHNFWPKCAGRIDWTTFVDFTNLAAAGEMLGWRTLFYGPQSALEHLSGLNLTGSKGQAYSVPGYSVLSQSWASRHVRSWYGRETLASDKETGGWVQRWTSFKVLLLEKPSTIQSQQQQRSRSNPVLFPSWHLDNAKVDECWQYDFTTVPLSDWIPRQGAPTVRQALEKLTEEVNGFIGRRYSEAYEEAQLAVRMVDWLVASGGCDSIRPSKSAAILGSEGLWKATERRLLKAWGEIWGDETVVNISQSIFARIASLDEEPTASPAACAGHQTYLSLCKEPGGGHALPWVVAAPLPRS